MYFLIATSFLKSDFVVCADKATVQPYAEMLNCQIGSFPIKYLGMPVSYSGLKCANWVFVDNKFVGQCEHGCVMFCPWEVMLLK